MESLLTIMVNGIHETIPQNSTILHLLLSKGINAASVVVEQNLTIITQDQFDLVKLKENDIIEILRFVGGGCS